MATKMIKGLEHMTHEEHRKLREDFINVHKYLVGEVKKGEPDSSPWGPVARQEAMVTH